MPKKTDGMLQLGERRTEIQSNLSAVVDDELPAELRERVRSLLSDLARNDLSMALLDLAQLSRSLAGTARAAAGVNRTSPAPGTATSVRVLIYGEGERSVTEQCEGPTRSGACPRVSVGSPVACVGRWIMAAGWRFMVASDVTSCPVAEVGVVRAEPSPGGSGTVVGTLIANPDDAFVSGPAGSPTEWSGDLVEEGCRLTC